MPTVATGCPPLFVGADATKSPLSVFWEWGEIATDGKNIEQQEWPSSPMDSPISVAGHPCSDAVTWPWQEGRRQPKGVG